MFEHKSELRKAYGQCMTVIVANHWYELLNHMKPLGNLKRRGVYAFEFPDKSVYVGLTGNFKKRKEQHLHGEKHTAVAKHIKETNLIPEYKIISDFIDESKAAQLEGETLEKYSNEGWAILNKVRTGGLGYGREVDYDFDETVKIASTYRLRREFANAHRNLYSYFGSRGLLEELFKRAGLSNMTRKPSKWNKENIIADAKLFDSYYGWIKARRHTSYEAARTQHILEEIKKLYD